MSTSDTGLEAVGGSIPEGGIIMWSGSVDNVPDGWTLCDGTDGAPDLQDRFVVGAGSSYGSGETGGAASVSLSEPELASHAHSGGSLSTSTDGKHSHQPANESAFLTKQSDGRYNAPYDTQDNTSWNGSTTEDGAHAHDVKGTTGDAGSGQPHENRPPFFALAFIMRTSA